MPGIEERSIAGGGTRYAVRVRDPNPKPGRTGYTSATFATRPEAQRFVRDVEDRGVAWALHEYHRGKDEADEMRLDQWAETHFGSLTRASQATVNRYRRIYRQWWSDPLGSQRLSEITRVDCAQALNNVRGSDKTVLNAWTVLTHMLKLAAQDGLIPRSPTVGVSPPRRTEHLTEEHRYLTHDEFWQVYLSTPAYWRSLVVLLGGSGMRWGELAALTVGDIDMESGVVRITKAEKQDPLHPGSTIVGPPKSKAGRRTVTLGLDVLEELEPLLDRRRTDRLFLPPKGGPLRHRTFYRDIWLRRSVGTSGIREPFPRLHDLRHSHVAWLIAKKVPLPVIQRRLGHESITTTIDTYGHLVPEIQQAEAEAANLVLGRRPLELSPAGIASTPG